MNSKASIFTEKETAINNRIQLFRLGGLMKKDSRLFYEISDSLPFFMNINRIDNLNSTFANNNLAYLLETDKDTIIREGYSLIRSRSHIPVHENVISRIKRFGRITDHDAICTYCQYIKILNRFDWVFTYKMFLNDELYLNMGHPFSNFGSMGNVLSNMLGETFIRGEGWLKFSSLTKGEKKIMKMLACGLSRKEISDRLFISEHTVRTHRQNIMQKIGAKSLFDIIRFTQAFEVIDEL